METLHITGVQELEGVAIIALGKLVQVHTSGETPVLALSGDLGAGKTTFMQALSQQLHITEPVISPTYVIMKRYQIPEEAAEIFNTLVHIDAYRIEDIDEMRVLGFQEVLHEPKTVVCIEWAEKIQKLLPAHTVYMSIEITGEESREITFS